MIELYKIMTDKYDPQVTGFIKDLVKPKPENDGVRTRGHRYKIEKGRTNLKTTARRSFIHRTCDLWNELSDSVVSAPSVRSFESRLDRQWSNQPFRYDATAEPPSSGRPVNRRYAENMELAAEDQEEVL